METETLDDPEVSPEQATLLSALAYKYFDDLKASKDFPAEEKKALLEAILKGTCQPATIMQLIPKPYHNLVGVFLRRLDRREFHPVAANLLAHKHKGVLQEWKFARENFPALLAALEKGKCNAETIASLIPGQYAKNEFMEFVGREDDAYEQTRAKGWLDKTRDQVQELLQE